MTRQRGVPARRSRPARGHEAIPRARRSLGQHFLVAPEYVERSLTHARLEGNETVLEIGPGLGTLTRALAARCKRVVAVELDAGLVDRLRDEGLPENVELIRGDATRVPLPAFDKVVSNLPYHISSPMTFRLLERRFALAVLMYQREFAQRLVAKPGTPAYSRLSVNAYVRAAVELLERVPPGAFRPRPRVSSAIVRVTPRKRPPFPLRSPQLFDTVVAALFSQRRKTIRNGLLVHAEAIAGSRDRMAAALPALPHLGERAEVLTPEELGALSDALAGALSRKARR